jgi:hypothetical protein
MRQFMLTAGLLASSALLFAQLQGNAQTPSIGNLMDTGTNEEYVDDYTSFWPEKIVADTSSSSLMLVWFDMGAPRHTTIPFSDIKMLTLTPAYEGRRKELQLLLNDGRAFLLASGKEVAQPAGLLAALLLKPTKNLHAKSKRIIPLSDLTRPDPHLVLDKLDSPEALKPPSQELADVPVQTKEEEGAEGEKESIGDDISQAKSTGKVSKNSIDVTIKAEMSRFRSCYQREFMKNPELAGKVVLQFAIGKEGAVKGAHIKESSLNSIVVERCMLKQLYGITFTPPAGGDVVISYPFTFSGG